MLVGGEPGLCSKILSTKTTITKTIEIIRQKKSTVFSVITIYDNDKTA